MINYLLSDWEAKYISSHDFDRLVLVTDSWFRYLYFRGAPWWWHAEWI